MSNPGFLEWIEYCDLRKEVEMLKGRLCKTCRYSEEDNIDDIERYFCWLNGRLNPPTFGCTEWERKDE